MCPGQEQQAGEERPHHQPYRNIKRPVYGLKVQPGQCLNVEDLSELPPETYNDRGGQDGSRGNLSIGQYPVDQEEEKNACEAGAEAQKTEGDEAEDDVVGVVEEDPGQDGLLAGGRGYGGHGEHADG